MMLVQMTTTTTTMMMMMTMTRPSTTESTSATSTRTTRRRTRESAVLSPSLPQLLSILVCFCLGCCSTDAFLLPNQHQYQHQYGYMHRLPHLSRTTNRVDALLRMATIKDTQSIGSFMKDGPIPDTPQQQQQQQQRHNQNNNGKQQSVGSIQPKSPPETPTVVVRRSRQSMEFRSGNPLIFEGAIAYTIGSTTHTSSSQTSTIPSGTFVRIEVEVDKSNSKPQSRSKTNRPSSSSSRRKSGKTTPSSLPPPPHYDVTSPTTMGRKTQLLGYGVFNPDSLYRVRILCHATVHPDWCRQLTTICSKNDNSNNKNTEGVSLIVRKKLQTALHLRQTLNLPSHDTDTYRLVNGEGDGLSGLAVDVLGGKVAVAMSSAAWCEIHRPKIEAALGDLLPEMDIVWKTTPSRLAQDGFIINRNHNNNSNNGDDDDNGGEARQENDGGDEEPRLVLVKENGIDYETFPFEDGQKTGVYCDQRINRAILADHCKGKRVLDLCCYHGGFSLNAMLHGQAAMCVAVDSSQPAIETAISNARRNGVTVLEDTHAVGGGGGDPSGDGEVTPLVGDHPRGIRFVHADIAQFMKAHLGEASKIGRAGASSATATPAGGVDNDEGNDEALFDVVVLDPPKLAPTLSGLDRACRKYGALNRDALKMVSPDGGLLLTCTCSAAMKQKDGGQYFLRMVQDAALAARRVVTLVSVHGAAPCHTQSPASYPAGAYLTAALFVVAPVEEGGEALP